MKYLGVTPTIIMNLFIFLLIVAAMYVSTSPLPLLGVFAMRDVQPQVVPDGSLDEEVIQNNPIGFVHHD